MVEPVAESAALTRFLAFVVLFVSCGITMVYALRNDRAGTLSIEIWRYVVLALGTGMAYAVVGSYELLTTAAPVAPVVTGIRQVLQLFFIVLLSLSMRELYYRLPYRDPDETLLSHGTARAVEAGFMAIVVIEFAVVIAIGLSTVVQAVQAVASAAFAVYGISFALGTRASTMSSGTVIDTILVRFIAVLTCLGAAGLLEGGTLLGVPPAVVDSAATVFIIMSATFLLVLAVRLRANVAEMSV